MIRPAKLSVFAFFAGVCAAAGAGGSGHLPTDQMGKAARTDSFSIPTPGELFAALGKPGKTNWSGQYRGPIPVTYRNRPQIALNLGGLIADGFIAVEAKDGQQVKNIGSGYMKLGKTLGGSGQTLSPGKNINGICQKKQMDTPPEGMERTPKEGKIPMQT